MRRIDKHNTRCEFAGEDGERLVVEYDNRGGRRGYSQGATFEFIDEDGARTAVYLENRELRDLHKTIGDLLEADKS